MKVRALRGVKDFSVVAKGEEDRYTVPIGCYAELSNTF